MTKLKRTGSNLKKEERILQGLYSSLYSTSHLEVLQIQTVIGGPLQQRNMGLVLVVPYTGKKGYYLFIVFPYYKSRKILSKRNWFLNVIELQKNRHLIQRPSTKPHAATVSNKFVILWTACVPWYLLCLLTTRSAFLRYYTLNVRSRGKQLVLFSRESWCFPRRSRGKHQDSRENKTNWVPEGPDIKCFVIFLDFQFNVLQQQQKYTL